MIVQVMGVIDLLAATFLFMSDLGVLNTIKIVVIAILLAKGVSSLIG